MLSKVANVVTTCDVSNEGSIWEVWMRRDRHSPACLRQRHWHIMQIVTVVAGASRLVGEQKTQDAPTSQRVVAQINLFKAGRLSQFMWDAACTESRGKRRATTRQGRPPGTLSVKARTSELILVQVYRLQLRRQPKLRRNGSCNTNIVEPCEDRICCTNPSMRYFNHIAAQGPNQRAN